MYILCTYSSLFNATKPVRFYGRSLLHLCSNIFLVVFQFPLHILALIPPLFLTSPNAFHFSLSGFHSQRHCRTSFCTERFIQPARSKRFLTAPNNIVLLYLCICHSYIWYVLNDQGPGQNIFQQKNHLGIWPHTWLRQWRHGNAMWPFGQRSGPKCPPVI